MRAYTYQPSGDAYALHLTDRPTPQPGPGRVRVTVGAVSLNYRDLIALRNKAGRKVAGVVPCSDGAGTVSAVGDGVTEWAVGDRVAGCFFQTWQDGRFDMAHHKNDLGGTLDGMLAEEVELSAGGVVRVPDGYSFAEAACLPCAALTAWSALFDRGRLEPGDTVLSLGTGGVSVWATQLAAAHGCRVVVTSSSDEKLARAKAVGASDGVNYTTTPAWGKAIRALTGGRGADHVVEVGGPGTLGQSLQACAAGGQVHLIGVLTGFGPPADSLFPAVAGNLTVNGLYVGHRRAFEAMNRFLEAKRVRPVIDRTFAFADADAAYRHLESGDHFGKVVVRVTA